MFLHQRKYVNDIVCDTGLQHAKPVPFPFPTGLKLDKDKGKILPNSEQYRRLVRCLLYLVLTRPDITYSIQQLSQYMQVPKKPHLDVALHVV